MVEANTRLRRQPDAAWRKIKDQVVVVTPDDGTLHTLNGAASLIWESLDGELTIEDIAAKIVCEYEVNRGTALEDIRSFAEEMTSKNMVERL
ncbi:MAG: PqqD family protein [bacterium]